MGETGKKGKHRITGKNIGKVQEKYRKTGENDENIGKQGKTEENREYRKTGGKQTKT